MDELLEYKICFWVALVLLVAMGAYHFYDSVNKTIEFADERNKVIAEKNEVVDKYNKLVSECEQVGAAAKELGTQHIELADSYNAITSQCLEMAIYCRDVQDELRECKDIVGQSQQDSGISDFAQLISLITSLG